MSTKFLLLFLGRIIHSHLLSYMRFILVYLCDYHPLLKTFFRFLFVDLVGVCEGFSRLAILVVKFLNNRLYCFGVFISGGLGVEGFVKFLWNFFCFLVFYFGWNKGWFVVITLFLSIKNNHQMSNWWLFTLKGIGLLHWMI